jgi:hypothetical protein
MLWSGLVQLLDKQDGWTLNGSYDGYGRMDMSKARPYPNTHPWWDIMLEYVSQDRRPDKYADFAARFITFCGRTPTPFRPMLCDQAVVLTKHYPEKLQAWVTMLRMMGGRV